MHLPATLIPRSAILLSVIFLASCMFPATKSVYIAEVPPGELAAQGCQHISDTYLMLNLKNVVLGASVRELSSYPNSVKVILTFEVPEGNTVDLGDARVDSLLDGKIYSSSKPVANSKPEWRVMKGSTSSNTGWFSHTWTPYVYKRSWDAFFAFHAFVSVPDTSSFELDLPDFFVNGVQVSTPSVKYTREDKWYIWLWNC